MHPVFPCSYFIPMLPLHSPCKLFLPIQYSTIPIYPLSPKIMNMVLCMQFCDKFLKVMNNFNTYALVEKTWLTCKFLNIWARSRKPMSRDMIEHNRWIFFGGLFQCKIPRYMRGKMSQQGGRWTLSTSVPRVSGCNRGSDITEIKV